MGRAAVVAADKLAAGEGDERFYKAKIASARFYADQMLPMALAYGESVRAGNAALALVTGMSAAGSHGTAANCRYGRNLTRSMDCNQPRCKRSILYFQFE
jgi:hypothetical protein